MNMAMSILIGRRAYGMSGGVFDCIVESTRQMFSGDQLACMKAIYETLDDQGQEFIALDEVSAECFNIFYRHCKAAMEGFPTSDRGQIPPPSHLPGILWHWSEVLRLMREDPRYQPEDTGTA